MLSVLVNLKFSVVNFNVSVLMLRKYNCHLSFDEFIGGYTLKQSKIIKYSIFLQPHLVFNSKGFWLHRSGQRWRDQKTGPEGNLWAAGYYFFFASFYIVTFH